MNLHPAVQPLEPSIRRYSILERWTPLHEDGNPRFGAQEKTRLRSESRDLCTGGWLLNERTCAVATPSRLPQRYSRLDVTRRVRGERMIEDRE
jgi:hypothetical protein